MSVFSLLPDTLHRISQDIRIRLSVPELSFSVFLILRNPGSVVSAPRKEDLVQKYLA